MGRKQGLYSCSATSATHCLKPTLPQEVCVVHIFAPDGQSTAQHTHTHTHATGRQHPDHTWLPGAARQGAQSGCSLNQALSLSHTSTHLQRHTHHHPINCVPWHPHDYLKRRHTTGHVHRRGSRRTAHITPKPHTCGASRGVQKAAGCGTNRPPRIPGGE